MNKLKAFISEYRELIQFLTLAFLLLLVWVLFISYFPGLIRELHYFLIKPQADISAYILRLFGYYIEQEYMIDGCQAMLSVKGYGRLCVGTGCSGLELFIVFFGLIIIWKGNWKDKLWFIPAGFIGILFLNILRIISLCLLIYHNPQYLDFNHKYTFNIIVYVFIFLLWKIWIQKFANKSATSE